MTPVSVLVFIFSSLLHLLVVLVCFFKHPTTPGLYTLSLHDALPISRTTLSFHSASAATTKAITTSVATAARFAVSLDRKSTRLNSSHGSISYAVFCLKKKKNIGLCMWSAIRLLFTLVCLKCGVAVMP